MGQVLHFIVDPDISNSFRVLTEGVDPVGPFLEMQIEGLKELIASLREKISNPCG